MTLLSKTLELRETYTSNLDNSENSKIQLLSLLKPERTMSYELNNSNQIDFDSLMFDHNRCGDCTYSHAITNDCVLNLITLQRQAILANSKLQSLVELREIMIETVETFDHGNLSPISTPTHGKEIKHLNNLSMDDEEEEDDEDIYNQNDLEDEVLS